MCDPHSEVITKLLAELRAGSADAFDGLFPLVYDELRRLARHQRHRWHGDETLTSTALVHEAYLRLVDQSAVQWESRAHFLSVASQAMRQILLDYAKHKRAAKRGGGREPLPLHEIEAALSNGHRAEAESELIVALDESLRRLEACEPRQSRIVECRFFGGMTVEESAAALGISAASVKRGWAMAQSWLYRDLMAARGGAA